MAQKSPHLHSDKNNDSGARSTVDSHELLAWDPQGTQRRISLAGHPSRYQPCTTGLYTGEAVIQTFQFQKRTSTMENDSYLKKTNQ